MVRQRLKFLKFLIVIIFEYRSQHQIVESSYRQRESECVSHYRPKYTAPSLQKPKSTRYMLKTVLIAQHNVIAFRNFPSSCRQLNRFHGISRSNVP